MNTTRCVGSATTITNTTFKLGEINIYLSELGFGMWGEIFFGKNSPCVMLCQISKISKPRIPHPDEMVTDSYYCASYVISEIVVDLKMFKVVLQVA